MRRKSILPRFASRSREQDRVRSAAGREHLVGERGPVGVDRRAAKQVLLELEVTERFE